MLLFLEQAQDTLDGLEEIRLFAGYRWDADVWQIGAPVISLHDGEQVIWVHELPEADQLAIASAVPVTPHSGPQPPEVVVSERLSANRPEEGQA
ncbi:hypothetical protein [Luteipulveratus mongoliensis]|uniref:hypothetical protein n=1 Tax=Luteipulveratus mongoliensis TaxID=571913 RepID=UPI0012ECFD1C|nr:hypothetical protein [Luteipulveratus mongoliensis]